MLKVQKMLFFYAVGARGLKGKKVYLPKAQQTCTELL
jgi:hypothetical protein